jgi:ABC-type sugar transport system ATPase subunit
VVFKRIINMPELVLHTEHLSKNYGPTNALADMNFSLEKGTVHALIGANGAGKSTFVKLLFGEILPTSGKIFIRDREFKINSPGNAMKNKIAMVSQDFGLINTMTIAENLAITNTGYQASFLFSPQKSKLNAETILSHLFLHFDVNRLVGDLSVSEKQLVAIAKAFSVNSDILIFDEPTSVLDTTAFEKIKVLIKNLKGAGKSIIYITHRLNEVFEVADFVTVLKDGKTVLTSKTTEVSKTDLLNYFNITPQDIQKQQSDKSQTPLYEVDNISTASLSNISFSIFKGEAVGIISDNYSNATDLVKTLYGITKKKNGAIKKDGAEVNDSPSENVKVKIGFITEDRRADGIFNNLNINENIGLMQFRKASKMGIVKSQLIIENTKEKIEQLGIKCESIFQFASELSGGNQQKVLFARWMSYDFDLLILLEPTSGIDLGGKSEIHFIISELKKKGKSFLIVSSDSDEVKNLCDRSISLNDGFMNDSTITNQFPNKN